MIKQMISLDPAERPTFDTLLHTLRGAVFPETFYSFLHNYVSSVNELSEVSPFSAAPVTPLSPAPIPQQLPSPLRPVTASPLPTHEIDHGLLPSDSDSRVERIWTDYDSVEAYIALDASEAAIASLRSKRNGTLIPSSHLQVYILHTCCVAELKLSYRIFYRWN
jgi:phosphoinositide-3-kinase, regulatory subunit 4